MAYNKENLVKLGHLEALGQRVKEELASVPGLSLATDAEVAEMLESVFGGTGTEGRNE
ncbi:MAG: hypothetical protein K2P33_04785 [Acutalibacter sp.]|nr:hypothetical protein [Acutalibacter sp.]